MVYWQQHISNVWGLLRAMTIITVIAVVMTIKPPIKRKVYLYAEDTRKHPASWNTAQQKCREFLVCWWGGGGRKGISCSVGLKVETQGAALLLSSAIAALVSCSKQGTLDFFPTKCITLLLFHYSFGYQPSLYLCSCMIFLTFVKWVRSVILWKRQPLFLCNGIKECHIKVLGVCWVFFFFCFLFLIPKTARCKIGTQTDSHHCHHIVTFCSRVWHWACHMRDAPGFFPLPWVFNSLQRVSPLTTIHTKSSKTEFSSFTNSQRLRIQGWDVAKFRHLLTTHTAEPSPSEDPSRNRSCSSSNYNQFVSPHHFFS